MTGMGIPSMCPQTVAALLLAAAASGTAFSAAPRGSSAPPASANSGRSGTYQCTTSHPGYNYYVYVPRSYSEENPAGLHLSFHGQQSSHVAPHFNQWKDAFLEPFNLVGINMQYTDENNMADTEGKVDAAMEAIRQTMADYKIVAGRGVVCSFSGGGVPHALLFDRFRQGQAEHEGIRWPFNHMSIYGSCYWTNPETRCQMSWYIGIGTGEWKTGMGNNPLIGEGGVARAADLYAMIVRQGYCTDVRLKIMKGKGHTLSKEDTRAAAEQFARSDLVLAPFLYEPDYERDELRELGPIAALANRGMPGRAAKKLGRLLGRKHLSDDVRRGAEALKGRLRLRIEKRLRLGADLLKTDPILALYYCKTISKQLSGTPEGRQLSKDLSAAFRKNKTYTATYKLLGPFAGGLGSFFLDDGTLDGQFVPLLEKMRSVAGERVLLGRMAGEFLQLR